MTELVLITRPQDQAEIYKVELEGFGYQTIIEPMLEIVPLPHETPDVSRYQGVIFTSANAVRMIASEAIERWVPVFVVGAQTAQAAKDAGFKDIVSAHGSGGDLVDLVAAKIEDKAKPLLHVRGFYTAMPIHIMLAEQNIQVELLTVYKAEKREAFSKPCLDAIKSGRIAAIPFFSKRTAQNFIDLIKENDLQSHLASIKVLSISDAVLECVRVFDWQSTHVSQTPDKEGMQTLLMDVFPVSANLDEK